MTVLLEKAYSEVSQLTASEQDTIARLILSSLSQQSMESEMPLSPMRPLSLEPVVGMWQDRDDIEDSVAYVRALRASQWSKNVNNHC